MNISAKWIAAACIAVSATDAVAQEVTLRIGDTFPVGHYTPENLVKVWMAGVEENAPGVSFEYFQAGQLGKAKDHLKLAQSGVLDIAYVAPSYVSDKLPMSSVAELPEAFTTACEGTWAYWKLAQPGGLLDEIEFKPNGVRVLMVMVLSPYQLYVRGNEIDGVDSFKGLKIRTTGGAKEIATVKLGGVPVQMAAPEARNGLTRGTIDALLFPTPSILPYDLATALDYATEGLNLGSFVTTYAISLDKWNTLSPEVQEAMTAASEAAIQSGCEAVDALNAADKQTITEAGVEYVTLSDADQQKISDLMAEVGTEWASQLDERGKKGTEVLEAFRASLASDGASN